MRQNHNYRRRRYRVPVHSRPASTACLEVVVVLEAVCLPRQIKLIRQWEISSLRR